ncbi:unnamed protein product [Agarophyton chilense]
MNYTVTSKIGHRIPAKVNTELSAHVDGLVHSLTSQLNTSKIVEGAITTSVQTDVKLSLELISTSYGKAVESEPPGSIWQPPTIPLMPNADIRPTKDPQYDSPDPGTRLLEKTKNTGRVSRSRRDKWERKFFSGRNWNQRKADYSSSGYQGPSDSIYSEESDFEVDFLLVHRIRRSKGKPIKFLSFKNYEMGNRSSF